MSPPEREKRPPSEAPSRHFTDTAQSTKALVWVPCTRPSAPQDIASQLRRRRAASCRLPGGDPWRYPEPGDRGYEDAAHHLLAHGLTPAPEPLALRAMWAAGGYRRDAAWTIADRWELLG